MGFSCEVAVSSAALAFTHRPAARGDRASRRSPGSRAESFLTCTGLRPRRARPPLALRRRSVWPSPSVHRVGARKEVFRGSIAGPPVPLSTLHPRRRRRWRMTRGQRGSLSLRCSALTSPTPCRFIPALSDSPRFRPDVCRPPLRGRGSQHLVRPAPRDGVRRIRAPRRGPLARPARRAFPLSGGFPARQAPRSR